MIRKVIVTLSMLVFIVFQGNAQAALPVKEWMATSENPFILYISGDGGMNSFSTGLCSYINKASYRIAAVNAKSYFWNKKTPDETASAISIYLAKQSSGRNKGIVLVGYSFGADVIPFIVDRLPDSLKNRLVSVVLLSPSGSTDFEIHWSDLLGGNKKRNMDVVAEINKMTVPKIVTIFGSDEKDFPFQNIQAKNYTRETLPGGHHFDGNTDEVARTMMKYFK